MIDKVIYFLIDKYFKIVVYIEYVINKGKLVICIINFDGVEENRS